MYKKSFIRSALPFFIYLIFNILLITFPLTNSLGYEFVFVNSIVLFFTGGIFVCKKQKNEAYQSVSVFILSELKAISLLLLIPLVVGSLSSVFNSRCPIKDGFEFYFVIAVPSFLLGIIFGFISSIITIKYNRIIFLLVTVLLLLTSLFEFYFYPQVYLYNPIFGFFPGTIYDEDVAVNLHVMSFQAYNLFLFGGLLFLLHKKFVTKSFTALTFLVLFAISILLKPFLGFATNDYRLKNVLNQKVSTEHFEISVSASINKNELRHLALLHEYYYEQVTQKLQIENTPIISSYIFIDKDEKRKLFGAGNADVSKPWMNKIFINYSNITQTLKHEIVHAAAANFGVTPLKVADKINMAMIEGFAMYAENDFDGMPIDYAAKLAFNNEYKVELNNLFNSGKFFTSYSSLAYIYSGAFIKFLSEKYGIKKVKELYGDLNFENILEDNLDNLTKEFEHGLSDSSMKQNKYSAQLYFGGQSIFKKFCPRMAANDLKAAQIFFQKKNYYEAENKYSNIYGYSSSPSSLIGFSYSLVKQQKFSANKNLLEKELSKFSKSQYLFSLELQLAASYFLINDTVKAKQMFETIEKQNPHINYLNRIKLLKLLWKQEGLEVLKTFLLSDETEKEILVFNLYEKSKERFLIPYFINASKKMEAKLDSIVKELKNNFIIENNVDRETAIILSQYLLKKGDFASAKQFAIAGIDNTLPEWKNYKAVENLRMVNWFTNFADETTVEVAR